MSTRQMRTRDLLVAFALIGFITGCGDSKTSHQAETGSTGNTAGHEATPKKLKFVSIGTGGMSGVYYPTGNNISRMLKRKQDEYRIKLNVESTGGSVYNINAILGGNLDFGIAQSDRQYQAYNGLAEWKGKKAGNKLRSVFALHPEMVTLVASEKSGIRDVKGLKGKKVNIGNPGSGHSQNARDIFSAVGIKEDDINIEQVKPIESPSLLQDDRIDAFFYTVGHPNSNIKEASAGREKIRIIPIAGPEIDEMIKKLPFYAKAKIAKEDYPKAVNEKDFDPVAVKATLVTSKDTDEDVVYAITKEVFENLDEFKKLHAAYKGLTKENMLEGLTAPLHPGAIKYFKEKGLDKYIRPELMTFPKSAD